VNNEEWRVESGKCSPRRGGLTETEWSVTHEACDALSEAEGSDVEGRRVDSFIYMSVGNVENKRN